MDAPLHLLLTHTKSHGQWKVPLRLISSPPLPSETIVIEGSVFKSVQHSLYLTRPKQTKSKFRAFFIEGSSTDLSVAPEKGHMHPENAKKEDDNLIVITFNASQVGKTVSGILVVEVT